MAEMDREAGRSWHYPSPLLPATALHTAVRGELNRRGLTAYRNIRPLVAKPQRASSAKSSCFGVALGARQDLLPLAPAKGDREEVWLPRVFVECVLQLRRAQSPGLFRKAGSVTRQRAMRLSLEKGVSLPSLLPSNAAAAHDTAALLKQFLRELPCPLLPPSLLSALEEGYCRLSGDERVDVTMETLFLLPEPHIQVFCPLLQLLQSVSEDKVSLMDSNSLAIVMTPNITPAPQIGRAALGTSLKIHTGIVRLLIDHAHLAGMLPVELLNNAHQIAEEGGAANDILMSRVFPTEEKREKQKKGSVTDRVIGWSNRIMSTIGGGGGGGVCKGATATATPQNVFQNEEEGEEEEGSSLPHFNPSLPPHPCTSKTLRNHKRRRSFLGRRRNTDHRRGNGNADLCHNSEGDDSCHGNGPTGRRSTDSHKGSSIFSLPFHQLTHSGSGLTREGAGRHSERKFTLPRFFQRPPSSSIPLPSSHPPTSHHSSTTLLSLPSPNVQLLSFEPLIANTGNDSHVDSLQITSSNHLNSPAQEIKEEEEEGGIRLLKTYTVSRKRSSKRRAHLYIKPYTGNHDNQENMEWVV